jgi:hypothetical protein
MRDRKNAYRDYVGNAEGKKYLQDLGLDGTIILKWIFKTWDGETWSGLIWLRIGTSGGLF